MRQLAINILAAAIIIGGIVFLTTAAIDSDLRRARPAAPQPGTDPLLDEMREQTKQQKRIADALEKLANKRDR